MNEKSLNKTLSRLMLVQVLYVLDIRNIALFDADAAIENVRKFYSEEHSELLDQINLRFVRKVLSVISDNLENIDAIIIAATSRNKDIDSLSYLLRAILRSGACEIIHLNTPDAVVINEYANLASDFCSQKEVAFVNAVLDKIAKQQVDRIS